MSIETEITTVDCWVLKEAESGSLNVLSVFFFFICIFLLVHRNTLLTELQVSVGITILNKFKLICQRFDLLDDGKMPFESETAYLIK